MIESRFAAEPTCFMCGWPKRECSCMGEEEFDKVHQLRCKCDELATDSRAIRKEAEVLLRRFKEAMDILEAYADPKHIVTPHLAKRFVDDQRAREDSALDSLLIAAMKGEPPLYSLVGSFLGLRDGQKAKFVVTIERSNEEVRRLDTWEGE